MELRHYRYFVALAEEMHFTRAAARLGIRQPSLSQQMNELEAEVGAILYRRSPLGAVLTEAGKVFLDRARSLLAASDLAMSAAQRAARGELGRLRLGFTGSSIFNPLVSSTIKDFKWAYPHVALELRELNTTTLLALLDDGSLDAAFVRPGSMEDHTGTSLLLAEEPLLVALPSEHRFARSKSLRLKDLSDDALIMVPRAMGSSLYDVVIAACRASGFEPVLGQEAPQITSAVNLVAAGLGISIVPAAIAKVKVAGVNYVGFEGRPTMTPLALAWRENDQPGTLRNLVALARNGRPSTTQCND